MELRWFGHHSIKIGTGATDMDKSSVMCSGKRILELPRFYPTVKNSEEKQNCCVHLFLPSTIIL